MDKKLLVAVVASSLVVGLLVKLGDADTLKRAKASAYNEGRGNGCSIAVQLLTPFGKDISCAVEADGALYIEGQMIKDGKVNAEEALAKAQARQ